ncbi:MAG: VanZ family protein [Gammaproteobacteria bacterium]
MSDELHQLFVPGRSADIFDVLADAVGGLLGAGLMVLVTRIIRQPGAAAE